MTRLTPKDMGLLTVPEAAAIAQTTESTVRVWIVRYHLPTVRFGGAVHLVERPFLDCERERRRARPSRTTRT